MEMIRSFIIYNMGSNRDVTATEIVDYMTSQGVEAQRNTSASILAHTRSAIKTALTLGWKPPPAR